MTMTAQYRKKLVKLVEKEKRKKTAEELIEKSKKALESPEFPALIEIIQHAPLKNDKRINLTQVHDKVFNYISNRIGDLQKAKELAVSARFLAMLKQDYWSDFAAKVAETNHKREHQKKEELKILTEKKCVVSIDELKAQQKPEPKPEPKDVEIKLLGDIIFTDQSLHPLRHLRIRKEDMPRRAVIMAMDLIRAATGIEYSPDYKEPFMDLRDYFIQILEEKFGLKIKICGNCGDYSKCLGKMSGQLLDRFYGCEIWHPKEAEEKK